ncbi:cyclin-dependent kinase inhibitor 4-like isoform X2 [Lotus japonicus]|uniref:cyclin-dependent kinase inhibitor 4-like isoform X2 n=1 Tax=Lotus japonicus TaxID=34305 RepID=UPI0025837284|nr:cyclin-dependent kinase inhibitor 4-like isoform X2 [Lotus japonicus]
MGKYMKKAKPRGEVALLDSTATNNTTTNTTTTSYFGVRTRAKTLALQKSQLQQPDLSPSSGSYLQLRSRRLHKPPVPLHASPKRPKSQNPKSPIPSPSAPSLASQHDGNTLPEKKTQHQNNSDGDEACFGENVLDFEGRERSTRESTPCNLIRDPDTVRTPGSTTRPTCSTEAPRRTPHAGRRQIPTAHEMNEFFAENEEAQQRKFIEKYNFDPVNEKPLPGRYEWEKLKP